ncbi:UDP-N-acetylglucosamine1-carboxyvinyltransferase [Syntrophothermus lipocalidus DSM 12680]|uniref:UDP-N-acetylglucosamine 1-carboxyvinyltransferase n=2 Tax=Syntrophothermus TaxID=129001 RepID=D7CJR4_SYNLT|nr:UDP-N-acetylglucosamine1-carboxyvinyltransferase [Syntrophothermus lipocalidus DSM 12680]
MDKASYSMTEVGATSSISQNKIIIQGGEPLKGEVVISPSKNAVLPILAACLLQHEGQTVIPIAPNLTDVQTMISVIEHLGLRVKSKPPSLLIENAGIQGNEPPYKLVRKMRASILVLAPLLARQGRAIIALPGGCAIGTRPIDLHLKGLSAMGADLQTREGKIEAKCSELTGAKIYLDFPSVGATETLMMAGVLARGVTMIENAALEPEIVNLAQFLNAMGGKVQGAGTNVIRIEGVRYLRGTVQPIIPDRIEAGTYMVATAITGGEAVLRNIEPDHLQSIIFKLRETGTEVECESSKLYVKAPETLRPIQLRTMPYPGFPTDMQPQFTALLTKAQGTSLIVETIFENRFLHVNELLRMGARIQVEGRTAVVQGLSRLWGARVRATDLRAGAALVIAALAACGKTEITGSDHIDRGYENMVAKLSAMGASVTRR